MIVLMDARQYKRKKALLIHSRNNFNSNVNNNICIFSMIFVVFQKVEDDNISRWSSDDSTMMRNQV